MIGFVTMDQTAGCTTVPDEDVLRLEALEEYFPTKLLELLNELDLLNPPAAVKERSVPQDCRSQPSREANALLVVTSWSDPTVPGKASGFEKSARELRRSTAYSECQDSETGTNEDLFPGTGILQSSQTCSSEKTLCTKSLPSDVSCGSEDKGRGTETELEADSGGVLSPGHSEMPSSRQITPVEQINQPTTGDDNNDYRTNLVQNKECLLTSRYLQITEASNHFSSTRMLQAQGCDWLKVEAEKEKTVSETQFSAGAEVLDKKQSSQKDRHMSCCLDGSESRKLAIAPQTLTADDVLSIETARHKDDSLHATSQKPPANVLDALCVENLTDKGFLQRTRKQKYTHVTAGNTSSITDASRRPVTDLSSATDPCGYKSEEIKSDKSQEEISSAGADDKSNLTRPVLIDLTKTGLQNNLASGSFETQPIAGGQEPPKRKRGRPRKQTTLVASRLNSSSEKSSQSGLDDRRPGHDIPNLFSCDGLALNNACSAHQRERQKEQKAEPCRNTKGRQDVKMPNCGSLEDCPPNKMRKVRPAGSDLVKDEAFSLSGSDCAHVTNDKQDTGHPGGSDMQLSAKTSIGPVTTSGSPDAGHLSAGLQGHKNDKSAGDCAAGRSVKQSCSSSASEEESVDVLSLGLTSLQSSQNTSEDIANLPVTPNSASTSSQHLELVANLYVTQTSSQSQQEEFMTDFPQKSIFLPPTQQTRHDQCESNQLLPDGWRQEVIQRTGGKFPGRRDVYIYSPRGTKFRSLKEIRKYASERKLQFDVNTFKKNLKDLTSPIPSSHGQDPGGNCEEGLQQGQALLHPTPENPPKRKRGRPPKVSKLSGLTSQARACPDVSLDVG